MMTTIEKIALLLLLPATLAACGGRKARDESPEQNEQQINSQRIENLSSALSRSQSRVEELDARISSLTDKMDSMKLQLDNISGIKPLKTQAIASHGHDLPAHKSEKNTEKNTEKNKEKKKVHHPTATVSHEDTDSNTDDAVIRFKKAAGLFKNGKYSDAIIEFNKFTEDYPEHILAGSAQFHVGESYLMMGQHKLAAPEFEKVVTTFSSSPRVASAMVRLADCHSHNGNAKEASNTASIAKDLYDGSPVLDSKTETTEKITEEKHSEAPVKSAEKSDDLGLEPMDTEHKH